LFQLLWGNDLLFHKKITQPLRHTSISYLSGRGMTSTSLCSREFAAYKGRSCSLSR
jgi:hypothetical protein